MKSRGIARLVREPLMHFFAMGAALFLLFAWLDDGAGFEPDRIEVDDVVVQSLVAQFSQVWQRPPSAAELDGLIAAWVREEVYYREGVVLGLVEGDTVIRRRVAQKVAFISEDLVPVAADDQALEAWLRDHPENYRTEPRVTFRQVFVDPDRSDEDPDARVESLRQLVVAGADAGELGDGSMLPFAMTDATVGEVTRTFGEAFAEALLEVPAGGWQGPLRSGFGLHLVRVERLQPARQPTLAAVSTAVARDYRHAELRKANERFYQSLLEDYDVRYTFTGRDRSIAPTAPGK